MNIYLIVILTIMLAQHLLSFVVERLNVKHMDPQLPAEFDGFYDADKYKQSQKYLKTNTSFKAVHNAISFVVVITFILAGGFNAVDRFARSFGYGEIITGLIFAGILMLAGQIFNMPFSIYRTFVIEERFGFNRTTPRTFIFDFVKGLIISGIIGGLIFSFVVWFFLRAGDMAWVYCWVAVVSFQIFLTFIAPVVIMPLFNKFIPLEDGELKTSIEDYACQQDFKLQGIFKMDGSRRSTKSNAFFTGFGKFRRIALFDTLIERHTVDELVSVLAHEIGHYKKKHIVKMILMYSATAGIMFFLLSLFIKNEGLFAAFRMQDVSVYASLLFFGFLYSPISLIFAVIFNVFSRIHEYEADRFAIQTHKKPQDFINALKKLSVNNLSNLSPHPAKVFFDYSHPPILKRIEAIRKTAA